jgi:hypothetical protein
MTIYEDLLYKLDNYPKFYRFEGYTSYPYFNNKDNSLFINLDSYIYFSSTFKHHNYYTNKKIRAYIDKEIMRPMGISFNRKYIIDREVFNEIEFNLINSEISKFSSISFITSSSMNDILYKNTISNKRKGSNDRRIERVDTTKSGGGYGLPDLYLYLFDLLTFAYTYQRITKDNLVEYLHILRYNLTTTKDKINPTSFLNNNSLKSIRINKNVFNDFSKYDILNTLQEIIDKELYFNDSIFTNINVFRVVLNTYLKEKEEFNDLLDKEYKLYIKK